jgi:hypothetical protein
MPSGIVTLAYTVENNAACAGRHEAEMNGSVSFQANHKKYQCLGFFGLEGDFGDSEVAGFSVSTDTGRISRTRL